MSSESEVSDYSQTLSEPEEEEIEEEDDNFQVVLSQIEPYQDEPLAEDDSMGEGSDGDDYSNVIAHFRQWPTSAKQRFV